MVTILLFFICHWYLSLFMQTFFFFFYAAHGAFYMNKFWERIFFLLAYFTQGSSYVSPRAYGIMHRMHHAYTDTDKDPHSPQFEKNFFKIMWRTRVIANDIYSGKMKAETRFLKNLPDWRFIDCLGHSNWSRVSWCAFYVLFYLQFAPSPWYFLLLPIHILMVPIQGVIINWFAHKYGTVNFKMKNTATNLFKVDVLMMGEAYHNNHHKNPSGTNFGYRWYEIDATFMIIRLLNWMKIIRIQKAATGRLNY